jgi:hypothetical protein
MKKIAMYQGQTEYPSLHITITDNPQFHSGRLCVDSVEETIEKVSAWLKKNLEGRLNDN